MRKIVGLILVGVGVFFLVLAPLSRWVVYPKVAVAPLTCTGDNATCKDQVLLSPAAGTATILFDPSTLTEKSNVPVTSMLRVRPDITSSVNGHTVYDAFTNVADNSGTTLSAFTERIAFDGHTSVMQNCCGANENGAPITDFSGLNPYKFPFGTEQQTYGFFDGTLNKPTPMKYVDEENIQGLQVYKFVQQIDPTQFGTLDVPGNLVGSTAPDVKAPEFYSNTRTVWVEPVTGVIVNGQEQQLQTLRGSDGTDKVTLIKATISFTDANVTESVKSAKDGKSQLTLIQTTLPIIGLVLGLILLALGLWMVLSGRRDGSGTHRQPQGAASVV